MKKVIFIKKNISTIFIDSIKDTDIIIVKEGSDNIGTIVCDDDHDWMPTLQVDQFTEDRSLQKVMNSILEDKSNVEFYVLESAV